MPWKVKGTTVVRADTGEVVSHHATKEKAKAAVRAMYANSKEFGGHKGHRKVSKSSRKSASKHKRSK